MRKKNYFNYYLILLLIPLGLLIFGIGYKAGKKYDLVLDENDEYIAISYSVNEQKMRRLMSLIDNFYIDTLNTDALVDKTIHFVTQNLDPHSVYIPKSYTDAAEQAMQGYYEGIGVSYVVYNDSLVITHTTSGSPNKGKFHLSDRIIGADGRMFTLSNIDSAGYFMKGKAGTEVVINILRDGQPLEVKAKRGRIAQPSVTESYMLSNDVGYIKLNKFIYSSADEFHQALLNLKAQGMKYLIFDLRGNPGGLVDVAEKIADEFLKKDELIVFTKDKQEKKTFRYATEKGAFEGEPLYILIDEGSASASEIVVGAIQDQDAGTIIGRRSYGKGLVQKEISLGDGSKIRLTTARYYTPTGRSIQKPYTTNDAHYNADLSNRYLSGELFSLDSIKKIDSLKFTTPKGKVVYGGGGIIPDVYIPIDSASVGKWYYEHGKDYFIRQAIFKYVDEHHEHLSKINQDHFVRFYQTDAFADQLLNEFQIQDTRENPKKYNNFKTYVKATIASMLYGENGYTEVWNQADPMIISAMELIQKQK